MNRLEAEKVIRQVEELPTLPAIIARILEVLEDKRSAARDLEKVVSQDQSIASKILRIANSAYYGFPKEITTIHRAIVLLGFQTVKGLALGSSIFKTFFRSGRNSQFDRTTYWMHSIACSRCAMALGRRFRELDPEEAFLAGLIHDIGMVVMDHVMHRKYTRILNTGIEQGAAFDRLEREAWGFDHGEVGAWLGERWKFPPSLLEAIRFHHRVSERRSSKMLVAVVHLADFCSVAAGLSVNGRSDCAYPQEEALKLTAVSQEDLVNLTNTIRGERDQIEAFFSVMSS